MNKVVRMSTHSLDFGDLQSGENDTSTEAANVDGIEFHSDASSNEQQTQYTNQNWLQELKSGFGRLIIQRCSADTREAVENNEDIQERKKRKRIEDEIINTTIAHLEKIFIGAPKAKDMREVAATMSHKYPALFSDCSGPESDEESEVTGFGNKFSKPTINDLAYKLVYRFRDRVGKIRKRGDGASCGASTEPKKKGKKKDYYGVDNDRFVGIKISSASVKEINNTSEEQAYEVREAIYEKHRAELQYQFCNSNKNVAQICKGFFLSHEHLKNQFRYVSRAESLQVKVAENLRIQISYMERYLREVDQSVDASDRLAEAETICNVEYQGSTIYKDIQIIRLLGDSLDGDGKTFLRFESDGPASSSSPYILAIHVENPKLVSSAIVIKIMILFVGVSFSRFGAKSRNY